MKALAINSGSSSLKFKLYNTPSEELFGGQFKHYSENSYRLELNNGEQLSIPAEEWKDRLSKLIEIIKERGHIDSIDDLGFIVHRVVHGGEKYTKPTLITEDVILDLENNFNELAPLHNPVQVENIKYLLSKYPSIKQHAVFDTTFNQTIPQEAYLYGLPYKYYDQFKIRRYGFHGISHKYVLTEYNSLNNSKGNRIISCHLGGGASVCAIKDNKVVENSFGFSPMENLIMSTRCGEVDYDALVLLKKKLNLSDTQLLTILDEKSGLLGISELTSDMKELVSQYSDNSKAKLAVDMFVYNVLKYIGSYNLIMGGFDVLIFTAGIGEGSSFVRKQILQALLPFGADIDDERNENASKSDSIGIITTDKSKIKAFVIPTNEELEMIREVLSIKN